MTDIAGNLSANSPALTLVIDTTAPAAPTGLDLAAEDDFGIGNDDNITNIRTGLTISGRAEPGTGINIFEGSNVLGATTTDANGAFVVDISLGLNPHSITARASDVAGNLSPSSNPLVITIVNPAPAAVIDSSTTLFG